MNYANNFCVLFVLLFVVDAVATVAAVAVVAFVLVRHCYVCVSAVVAVSLRIVAVWCATLVLSKNVALI